jgi:hypothetical protein
MILTEQQINEIDHQMALRGGTVCLDTIDLIASHREQAKLIAEYKKKIRWFERKIPVSTFPNYLISFPPNL